MAQHITKLALHINEPLVHYLVVGRGVCRDLDSLLILLVIIQRATRHPEYAQMDPRAIADGRVTDIPSLPANLQSIAHSTGIPKETVRRKVQSLVQTGWVARDRRSLRLTVEGYLAITPLRDAAIRMMAAIVDAVNRTLAKEAGAERVDADEPSSG